MKKLLSLLLVISFVPVIVEAFSTKSTQITAAQLKKMLDKGQDFTLINVLSEDAFEDCHIKHKNSNAIPGCIPFFKLENIAKKWSSKVKESPIYVYCASEKCVASQNACEILQKLGFKKIFEYKRGMREWLELGYPSVGPCKMEYLFNE